MKKVFLSLLLVANTVLAEDFAKVVGEVGIGEVKENENGVVKVPYITWGGDVATFLANGGLTTKPDSIFAKHNLNISLFAGDDFPSQIRAYLGGDTPYIRGTLSMLGLASEVLSADPRTKPVVIFQMTWSAGDHMVARSNIKNVNSIKKVCLQQGGPHVGMLDEILSLSKRKWSDVQVVFTKDLTGANGPADAFRNDPSIDACFVISPDMIGLTGGLTSKGGDAEGNVKDSYVLVSTSQMSRSIADVYAVRKDYFDANREKVLNFTASYLRGVEELLALKKDYDNKGPKANEFVSVLKMAQDIYGVAVLPTLEVDAYGLVADATFVRLPGNISFFTDKGNLNNFDNKVKTVLDLAVGQGYAKIRTGFTSASWDYKALADVANIEYVAPQTQSGKINAETAGIFPDSELDSRTILSFTINFEPNQNEFPVDVYGSEFQRVLKAASTFGNAVVAIRGHSDPTQTIVDLLKVGMSNGIIKRSGTKGNYSYFFEGEPLNIQSIDKVVEAINTGKFIPRQDDLNDIRDTLQAALNLSKTRAETVKNTIIQFAKNNNINLDASQIQPVGIGIKEPLVAKPKNMDEAKKNMRVEFRIVKVPAEAIKQTDFDY